MFYWPDKDTAQVPLHKDPGPPCSITHLSPAGSIL